MSYLRSQLEQLRSYASVLDVLPSNDESCRSGSHVCFRSATFDQRQNILQEILCSLEETRAHRALILGKDSAATLCGQQGCITSEFFQAFRIQLQALNMIKCLYSRLNPPISLFCFRTLGTRVIETFFGIQKPAFEPMPTVLSYLRHRPHAIVEATKRQFSPYFWYCRSDETKAHYTAQ
jgi:hypothetical protein